MLSRRTFLKAGLGCGLILWLPSRKVVSVAEAQTPTTFIDEDWEGSNTAIASRWPDLSQGMTGFPGPPQSAFTISTSRVFSGSQSLRYNYVGTQHDTDGLICASNPGGVPTVHGGGSTAREYPGLPKDLWTTWFNYMDAGFKTAGGIISNNGAGGGFGGQNFCIGVATKGLYSYMRCPQTGQIRGWVFHYFYGGRQLTLSAQGIKDAHPFSSQPNTIVPYDTENMFPNRTQFVQPDNAWIGYEANFKFNTPGQANGHYRLYATNMTAGTPTVLVSEYLNREFVDATPTGTMPSDAGWYRSSVYRQDGLGFMYYDRIRVTNFRVGVTGTPPAGDTTPPGPPQQFRVS